MQKERTISFHRIYSYGASIEKPQLVIIENSPSFDICGKGNKTVHSRDTESPVSGLLYVEIVFLPIPQSSW